MATAPALLSIDDYLRTSYKPDVHFVDGHLEERNVGEFEHASFQSAIAGWFWPRRAEWSIHPVVEQRMRVQGDRVRICDVAVLRAGGQRERVTITPPLICIEILSPEDRLYRARVVLTDYLAMGVENIWLIDPLRRAAFTFGVTGLHEADSTRLIVSGTAIHLDLTEAFAAIE